MATNDLIEKIKTNLIINDSEDDYLIGELAATAVSYAKDINTFRLAITARMRCPTRLNAV